MNEHRERTGVDNDDHELLTLLDRQEQPSLLMAERFDMVLQQQSKAAPVSALFQRYWPSRPAWAFAYSCCLVGIGVLAGQLPLEGDGKIPDSETGSAALVCPVHTSPGLWLPADSTYTLA